MDEKYTPYNHKQGLLLPVVSAVNITTALKKGNSH